MQQLHAGISDVSAGIALGSVQLVVSWFILGNEEVLMQLTPLTVSAVVTASMLTWIGYSTTENGRHTADRLMHTLILVSFILFMIIAAVGTSRGSGPIGDPPVATEWILTLVLVTLSGVGGSYAKALP